MLKIYLSKLKLEILVNRMFQHLMSVEATGYSLPAVELGTTFYQMTFYQMTFYQMTFYRNPT